LETVLTLRRFFLLLTILSAAHGIGAAQTPPSFPTTLFQKPVKVFGDPEYTGTASNPEAVVSLGPNVVEGREFNFPEGVALDTSQSPPILYVADTGNNRVLGYRFAGQLTPGSVADLILGQQDRFQNLPRSAARTTLLTFPTAVAVDKSGNVYVADSSNNRIVRYPKPFAQPPGYQIPDLIFGQKSFAGNAVNQGRATPGPDTLALSSGAPRTGITFDVQGNLWVADSGNNRVIRYGVATLSGTPANGPNADTVVGQIDFVSTTTTTNPLSKVNLNHPVAVAFDSAGRMFVPDQLNGRIVVYPANAGVATNAIRLMGLDTLAGTTQISLSNATSVVGSGSGVIVADTGNHRLMVFPAVETWPPENPGANQYSPPASAVIGQPNFTANKSNQGAGDASASSLNSPTDVFTSGSEVYVADSGNHRVLVFPASPGGVTGSAVRVIGQLGFPYDSVNLIEGKEFNFGPNTANGPSGSAILDYSSTPPHLYVADTNNNRILGFKDFTSMKNGQKADLVIGQPDFFRSVINYPTNQATQPNAQGLNGPTSLVVDSAGNLYVADFGNSRVLRFPAPFNSGQTSLQSADMVIGQASFTSIVTDATERTLAGPLGLALTADGFNNSITSSGFLIVADAVQNRVLFFPKPFSTGIAATKVLGQLNFNSTSTSADPNRFAAPRAVAVDPQDRVLVADTGNRRLQIFSTKASDIQNFATPQISIPGFGAPISVAMSSQGSFWVADTAANAVLHFPTIDQLPLQGLRSDGSVPVGAPRTAFTDPYGNLLAGDGFNRILYFAPQVDIVNAANYSARPLAPGTIVALFPHKTTSGGTSVLSDGTGTITSLPWPTTLADTNVIVNGVPAAMYYVSPAQINLMLSNSLPSGGTVDLQVMKASTGQIYGGAEVPLATASPGMFTLTTTGGGQIAAINQDGTINSPQNPIPKGQVISLYGTGQGYIPNAPPDGFPSPVLPTPVRPQILIGNTSGGNAAYVPDENIQYSGLAPTLVGVWQINVLIPTTAPSGSQVQLAVLQASVSSQDPASTSPPTVIAIK
jgi:uncharacterized protein (TIGR03437 family)